MPGLDEVRISKGIARWTSDFTPPTAPYSVPVGVPGSSVALTVGFDPAPSGGLRLNGSVVVDYQSAPVYTVTPSGGIILGGLAAVTRAVALTETGGIVLGGTVAATYAFSFAQTGGIVLGGTAAVTRAVAHTPSGGIVLGGSVAQSVSKDSTLSGGIVLNGSVAVSQNGAISVNPSGGIQLGGSAASDKTIAPALSGGIVLGGSCVTVLQLPGPIYTVTPSGGLVLGGSTVYGLVRAFTPAGGIVLGGTADVLYVPPGPTYTLTPSGGILLNGTCSSSQSFIIVYNLAPVGGIVFGGVSGTAGEAVALPPIVDRIDGGWTDQTGGTELYAAVDEIVAADSDFIKSTSSPITADICEIEFTPAIDPFSSTGHTLSYRYGSDAEGWTTVTHVLTAAQADAITQYGHISVKFEAKV